MKIIFSIGDINGIGIEVMLKGIQSYFKESNANEFEIAIACHKRILIEYAEKINFDIYINNSSVLIGNKYCEIIESKLYYGIEFGKISKESGLIAIESLELATNLVISKEYDALITLPITKKSMYLANWNFPGHTEYLGFKTKSQEMMILASDNIRVALGTIHIPISKVSSSITKELLIEKIDTFNFSLKNDFGLSNPKIAVLGLNPHAGESGSIGMEEIAIIKPAIDYSKSIGINSLGSFPADGFFAHKSYLQFDGILAMYHDQGLIPLKLLANGGGVNITSGLPIIRTSPDHGSALEIAGKNVSNPQSLIDSIKTTLNIITNRKNN